MTSPPEWELWNIYCALIECQSADCNPESGRWPLAAGHWRRSDGTSEPINMLAWS